jgi:hypothetical protein
VSPVWHVQEDAMFGEIRTTLKRNRHERTISNVHVTCIFCRWCKISRRLCSDHQMNNEGGDIEGQGWFESACICKCESVARLSIETILDAAVMNIVNEL